MHNQFDLLKTRRFLPFFLTQFLGAFNDNVFKQSLIILLAFNAASMTTLSPSVLANLCAGLFILPFFLFSATAGQLADKYEKTKLIKIIKGAEIFIMLLAVAGFYYEQLWLLLLALFLMGAQSSIFGPIKYAILPQSLTKNELIGGNALVEMATSLAILLGSMLGGFLIAIKPEGKILVSWTIMIIAILGFISCWRIPRAESANKNLKLIGIRLAKHGVIFYLSNKTVLFYYLF